MHTELFLTSRSIGFIDKTQRIWGVTGISSRSAIARFGAIRASNVTTRVAWRAIQVVAIATKIGTAVMAPPPLAIDLALANLANERFTLAWHWMCLQISKRWLLSSHQTSR